MFQPQFQPTAPLESRCDGNDRIPTQSLTTFCPNEQTGGESKQRKIRKAEGVETSSFAADGHEVTQLMYKMSKTNRVPPNSYND